MATIKTIAIQDLLKKDGLELKRNNLVSYKEKESFQFCVDLVDIQTGDVFSFIGTEGESEVFAVDMESLNAYNKNIIMNIE